MMPFGGVSGARETGFHALMCQANKHFKYGSYRKLQRLPCWFNILPFLPPCVLSAVVANDGDDDDDGDDDSSRG